MFKVCCHSVCISEKSYFRSANISQKSSFSFKTKISTDQLSCRAFQLSSEGAIPDGYPRRSILLFQASGRGQFLHIAFARDVRDSGTLDNREKQTR